MRALLVFLASFVLASGALAQPVPAGERFLSARGVPVTQVTALPGSPADAAWTTIKPTTLLATPQHSVRLNDAIANQALELPPVELSVRAVSTSSALALLVEWKDETQDRTQPPETNTFGDALAVEMPRRFGAGIRLPYIGMGDEEQNVVVAMVRAAGIDAHPMLRNGTYVGAGFGSLTRAPMPWLSFDLTRDEAGRRWRAMLSRPLLASDHQIASGLVPFALAVWDGQHKHRGGNKYTTAWHVLRIPALRVDPAYLDQLAFGYGDKDLGDVQRGKALVEAVCVACHRMHEKRSAPEALAPDLTNVGAIASPAYLRDSILQPSQVIVPFLNLNRHLDRSKPADRHGAFPSNEALAWHVVDAEGKKTSKMPAFSFPPEQLADIVAYLHSLQPTRMSTP